MLRDRKQIVGMDGIGDIGKLPPGGDRFLLDVVSAD